MADGGIAVKERPILFSAPMVRALLEGRKTQTRRLVKMTERAEAALATAPDPLIEGDRARWNPTDEVNAWNAWCPYGEPGDRLWVRETFYCDHCDYPNAPIDEMRGMLEYRADHDCRDWEAGCPCRDDAGLSSWRPSIHMPRWASRINLRVTSVRVERLQAITANDAIDEGIRCSKNAALDWTHRDEFAALWDAINGKRATWHSNPWVWVVGFEVMR